MAGPIDPKVAEELGKAAEALHSTVEETTKVYQEQFRIISQMRDVMRQMGGTAKDLGDATSGAFSTQKLTDFEKNLKAIDVGIANHEATMKKYAKRLATAGAVAASLYQGFKNLVAIGRGVAGVFMGIADSAWAVSKSIIAIPFKLMQGVLKMASQGGGDNSYQQALENIRKEYGDLQNASAMAIKTAALDLRTLNLGGLSTYRVFGNAAQQLEAITKMAMGMGAAFQTFKEEVKSNGAAMAAYNKGLGVTDEMMSGIASNAIRMGTSITSIQNSMTKQSIAMSKAFGVEAKVISRDMGKAMQDLAHFGALSTKEIAVAATFANKLGVSVDKLTGIMDATKTFDQAAEGMSKLNEQFGFNIDATELMMANSPAEQVALLQKQFRATGKDISQMNRYERDLIKQNLNLDDSMINAAFSAKGLSVDFDKMQKQGDKNEKKTLTQTEALSKLADSMERIVQSGSHEGGIFAHFLDGLKRGIMSSQPFLKMMYNIRHIFRIARFEGIELGRKFVDMFPGVKDVFEGLRKTFDPKRWKEMFKEVGKAFDVFRVGGSGKIEDFMERIKGTFSRFFAGGKEGSQQIIQGFKNFGSAVVKILIELGKWTWKEIKDIYGKFTKELENPGETTLAIKKFFSDVIKSVSNWITKEAVPFAVGAVKTLTNWLKDPKSFKNEMPAAGALGKMLSDIFTPLGDALMFAGRSLYPVLTDLAVQLFVKLKEGLIAAAFSIWKNTTFTQKLTLGLVQFGPLLMKSLISSLVDHFKTKMLEKAIAQAISNSMASSTIGQAFQQGQQQLVAQSEAAAARSAAAGGASRLGALISAPVVAGFVAAGLAIYKAYSDYKEQEGTVSQRLKESADHEDFMKDIKTSLNKGDVDLDELYKKVRDKRIAEKAKSEELHGTGFINAIMRFGDPGELEKLADKNADEYGKTLEMIEKMRRDKEASFRKGTWQYEKRIQEEQAKEADEAAKRQLDALGPVTIKNAAERFKQVEELAKKVMDKGFNIQDKLAAVEKKLSGIKWSIMTPEAEKELNKTYLQMQKIQGIFISLADVGGLAKVAVDKMSVLSDKNTLTQFEKLQNVIVYAIRVLKNTGQLYSSVISDSVTETWAPKISKMFGDISSVTKSLTDIMNVNLKSDEVVQGKMSSISYAVGQVIFAITSQDRSLIRNATDQSPKIVDMMRKAVELPVAIDAYIKSTGKFTKEMVTTSAQKTLSSVREMMKAVNDIDSALADVPKIDIKTRLGQVAGKLGLSSSGEMPVMVNKNVVMHVSFEVSMDAAAVEKAIVYRSNSIIRDRINYALGGGQGKNESVPQSLHTKSPKGGDVPAAPSVQ